MTSQAPQMSPLNLGLRFALEMAALAGIYLGTRHLMASTSSDGVAAPAVGILAVVGAVACWGLFNVEGDPSRSGQAPVAVAGWVRLCVELTVFSSGAVGLATSSTTSSMVFGALCVVHLVASHRRLRWLLAA